MEISKTKARKAAKSIRKFIATGASIEELDADDRLLLLNQVDVVERWRASYAVPLLSVRMSFTSFVRTNNIESALISQRHKRMPRIITKLVRYPDMNITTMDDIGGCRVIVPTLANVKQLQDHAVSLWGDKAWVRDYVNEPKVNGYRAVHVMTERNDRRIETQIRTQRQHLWADTVERISRRIGQELKWTDDSESGLMPLAQLSDELSELDESGVPFGANDFISALNTILGRTDSNDSD